MTQAERDTLAFCACEAGYWLLKDGKTYICVFGHDTTYRELSYLHRTLTDAREAMIRHWQNGD